MTEATESRLPEHMKAFRCALKDLRAALLGEFKDVKNRLGTLEAGQASVIQHIGRSGGKLAAQV